MANDDQDPTAVTDDQPSGPDPESTATSVGGAGVGGGGGIGAAAAGPLAGAPDPMTGVPTLQAPHPGLLTRLSHGLQTQAGIPASRQVQNRFGGLITGLAGLLIDGLSAGMAAPQGRPDIAFQNAMQIGNQNRAQVQQQQAMGMGQMGQLTPEQQDQFQSLQRSTQKHQTDAMINSLPVEQEEQFVAPYIAFNDQMIKDGYIKPLAQSTDRTQAFNETQRLRGQAGKDGAHIDFWPVGRDDQGRLNWVVGQYNPLQRTGSDMNFTTGAYLDDDNTMQTEQDKIPANTNVGDALAYGQQAYLDRAHDLALLNDASKGKGSADALKDAYERRAMQIIQRGGDPATDSTAQKLLKAETALSDTKAKAQSLAQMYAESVKDDIAAGTGPSQKTQELLKAIKAQKQSGDPQTGLALALNSYSRYQQTMKDNYGQLDTNQINALKVLATPEAHQSFATNLLEVPEGELMNILSGEPLSTYSPRLMAGTMTKDQWDALKGPGQKIAADYFNALMQSIVVARARTGTSRPPQSAMQIEMNTVPVPYVDPSETDRLFSNTISDVQAMLQSVGGQIPATTAPARAPQPAPEGTVVRVGNQTLKKQGGQWVPQQ